MNVELLERLRKELEVEREARIAELRSYGADPLSGSVAHIDGVDDGFADSAAATSERAEVMAHIEVARERLAEADVALHRMDAGTYGTCANCGTQIPVVRLEARPLSVLCVECAAGASA